MKTQKIKIDKVKLGAEYAMLMRSRYGAKMKTSKKVYDRKKMPKPQAD